MIDRVTAGTAVIPGTETKARSSLEAARQFESLLIAQLLRSMREAGGSEGWLGGGEDSSSAPAMEMAEEHFAAELAHQGGLGLATMVARALPADSAVTTGTARPRLLPTPTSGS